MSRSRFFNKTYRSNYRGKVSVEDAVKHQAYLDDMKKDAVFYCLDHIESSMIPHSMLHKIIQKLKTKQNNILTLSEKAYLIRQNLNALHSLVEGKISFNQYKKEAINDREKYKEHLEEKRLRLETVKELELIELKKQQKKLVLCSSYRGQVSVEDAIKHQKNLDDIKKDAVFYCLDHIESSMIPHSMLHKIIQKLKTKQNDSLTFPERAYLIRQNLNALHSLVEGQISFNQYKKEAINDREKYKEHLEAERLHLEKVKELELIQSKKQQEKLAQERKVREQAERERRKKLESDPKYIERKKEKNLLKKYDIYFDNISRNHRSKLINILKLLDNNQRLVEQDAIWLNSEGWLFFTDEVKIKFHRIEADFYINEYKISKSHWHAINASAQLRKAKASKEAEKFLENTEISLNKNKKLLSAYFTTLGGVKRDIRKVDTAIECGLKAHESNSRDYRPCTLLGAIYMENHEYTLGHDWYSKARDRGAPENAINTELRSILLKLDKEKRLEMITSLVKKDPYIYGWLNSLQK